MEFDVKDTFQHINKIIIGYYQDNVIYNDITKKFTNNDHTVPDSNIINMPDITIINNLNILYKSYYLDFNSLLSY